MYLDMDSVTMETASSIFKILENGQVFSVTLFDGGGRGTCFQGRMRKSCNDNQVSPLDIPIIFVSLAQF